MFRKLIGACVGLAMMGMAGTANAVTFTGESAFLSATSGLSFESFETFSPLNTNLIATSISVTDFTITSTGSFLAVYSSPNGCLGSGAHATDGSNYACTQFDMTFVFDELIDTFGFTMTEVETNSNTITTNSGLNFTLSGLVDLSNGSENFFGFTDPSAPFTSLTLTFLFGDRNGVDGVYYGQIPEPSTLALFATGLALLALFGWRRRGSKWLRAA